MSDSHIRKPREKNLSETAFWMDPPQQEQFPHKKKKKLKGKTDT